MGSDVSLSKAVRTNLLSLQNTATMMDKTQNRLATGNKVNSALDNPSSFFTASALNSRAADMSNLLDSMASGVKVIEAANNGLTAITKNVESMQSTLRQARQDKSFSAVSVEVTDKSVLNIAGGQLAVDETGIKLTNKSEGMKASVTSTGYTGATPSTPHAEGVGARSLLTLDASTSGDVISVDGKSITLGAASNAADVKAKLDLALGGDGMSFAKVDEKYSIVQGNGTNGGSASQVVIEAKDPTKASPAVLFVSGNTAAVKGTTSFNFANVPTAGITVGGQTASNTDGDFDKFVKNLQDKATVGGYVVNADSSTKQITLTNAGFGASAPSVTAGLTANSATVSALAASSSYDVTLATTGAITVAGESVTLDGAGTRTTSTFTLDLVGGGTFDIGGDTVTVGAGDTDAAVLANINTSLGNIGSAYTAAVVGGVVTLTAGAVGASTPPVITNPVMPGATVTPTVVTGKPAETELTIQNKINAALQAGVANGGVDRGFRVVVDPAVAGVSSMRITAQVAGTPAGAATAPTASGTGISGAPTSATNGIAAAAAHTTGFDAVVGTATGSHVETVAAATDDITVNYGGQSVAIKIGARASNSPTDTANWRDATVASVNAQLAAKGMNGVEAKFDDQGEFQLVAKNAEAGTLAVSGTDAANIFAGATVSNGEPPVAAQNATKPVDKFVELINTKFAGKLRATNDGGKLRIENLSTQDLNVSVDKDGVGSFTSNDVKGNMVRTNLSKEFNNARDQLDRLSDDASFNGINLLRGDKLKITFNESGSSSIDIQSKNADGNVRTISSNTLGIDFIDAENLDTDEAIDGFLAKLSSALTELRSQASTFGSNLSSVENRQNFTKNMINTLETGAANLTLADTNEEAANLLALQTRQQLSSSALSMASQQDQAVLQLLR